MTSTPSSIWASFWPSVVIRSALNQLRSMLHQHEADPKAGAVLGYVYRLLWYLQWKNADDPRERARDSVQLLASSIRTFYDVHRLHPGEYFSGYNALLLI